MRGRNVLPLTGALLCLGITTATCARQNRFATPAYDAPVPARSVLYTATRCIRAFAIDRDGMIWAATEGGVLRWRGDAATAPEVWTTANGLPSNDIRAVTITADGAVLARSPAEVFRVPLPEGAVSPPVEAVGTGNARLSVTASGLRWLRAPGRSKLLPLPEASRGSHVSAVTCLDGAQRTFAVAIYGDGVYRLTLVPQRSPRWERLPLPDSCRNATALATLSGERLVIGTRYEGAFVALPDTGALAPLAQPHGLPSGDIYGLAAYRPPHADADRLYATTFDRGVLELDVNGPCRLHPEVTQGRALVPFGDRLYVLGADHRVRAFDGARWDPAWSETTLRRPEVYSVARDRFHDRLLVGGWGGWAAWDGECWEQHWNHPELQGEGVTAIAADARGAVWVGTQRRGLFRCKADTCTPFQEAQGLTDDWITALAVSARGRLLVGTYSGGLLEQTGERLTARFHSDRWAIRSIVFDGETALVATPVGVYREPGNGGWQKLAPPTTGGTEAQAILPTMDGLWIGTRSGLAFRHDANVVRR